MSLLYLLYHLHHKDALFLRVFIFDLKENSTDDPCGADDKEDHTQHTVIWRDTEETVDKGIFEYSCYFCFLCLQKVFPSLHITKIAHLMADVVF